MSDGLVHIGPKASIEVVIAVEIDHSSYFTLMLSVPGTYLQPVYSRFPSLSEIIPSK
jgi:hypothetical protein